MQAIILYKSKYGASKEAGELIGVKTGAFCTDIGTFCGSLEEYDTVVLGCGVYAGTFPKELKEFCIKNEGALLSRKVFFFATGLGEGSFEKECQENLSKKLVEHLTYRDKVGSQLNFPRMNMGEKILIKMINKKENYVQKSQMKENVDMLDDAKIQQFAERVMQLSN